MPEMNFDPNQHEPNDSFDPLPTGWYVMRAIASDIRETKSGDGEYLWLEFEIDPNEHPSYAGRRAWDRLNLWNKNQDAVRIAQGQLSALCRALGVGPLTNSEQLHGLPVQVKLVLREAGGGYDASNDVKGYKAPAGNGQAQQAQAATAASGAGTGGDAKSDKPPWMRR